MSRLYPIPKSRNDRRRVVHILRTISRVVSRLLLVSIAATIISACGNVNTKNFAEGLRVMSGRGGTVEEVDTFPTISKQANQIRKAYPAPTWQKMYKADAADIFELLPGHRLLMGEVQVSTAIAEPEYGDLALYDLNSGERLWTMKRRDLEWGRYNLLAVEGDQIIMQGVSPKGGFYTAISARSGHVAWEQAIKTTTHSAYAAEQHRLYLLDAGTDKCELLALDSRSGKLIWQSALGGVKPGTAISLLLQPDGLFVLAGGVHKISSASGALVWEQSLPDHFIWRKETNMRLTQHGLLLWDPGRIAMLRTTNGKLLWGSTDPGKYEVIKLLSTPVTGEGVFVWTSQGNITSFDPRSGNKRWKYALDKNDGTTLQSPIFVHNNKVYFSTYKTLIILDARTGARVDKLSFPFLESGLFSSLTPDILIARDDKVIMLREGGAVYALSSKTNKLLWKQVVKWNYEMFFNSTQISNTLKKALTDKAYANKQAKDSAQWWSNWTAAVDYQWRGYHYAGSVGDPGLSSTGANMVFAQAMFGLSDVTAHAIRSAALEGLAERLNMELDNASRNHLRSVQQGYFLRPYDSRNGTLVMLVNLDSGKRYDLIYSPTNTGMRYIDMRLPAFIIDPSGMELYTTEIGTDPGKYERYVKFKYGMPYPSILRYKLSSFRFESNSN